MANRHNANQLTDVIELVAHNTDTIGERLVFFFIYFHDDHTFHGPKILLEKCLNMGWTTINNSLTRLIAKGLIKKHDIDDHPGKKVIYVATIIGE